MISRRVWVSLMGAAGLASASSGALAQETVKIGMILPLTGPFTPIGKQVEAGAKLYLSQIGGVVAGKKIEIVLRDDGGVPDATKRIATELVVNEKVNVLAGFGLTPLAMATAPIATQSKTPLVVMAAGTTAIVDASPFIARTSFTQAQSAATIADWAAKNGIKKVVTLVTDYAPGIDSEKFFSEPFKAAGGEVLAQLRAPLQNPDYAPFLQRVIDAKPDAIFVFVPAGVGAALMKQYVERGMDKSGIRLIGPGDITDDDLLNGYGDSALGVVTAHLYSANHPSAANKAYVEAFKKANNMRPNFMSLGGYDGMRLITEALKKTNGATDGPGLIAAMKGMSWESPRGPISIDPDTRDIVQNIYIRKVEKVDGELYNVEFETYPSVKDPARKK